MRDSESVRCLTAVIVIVVRRSVVFGVPVCLGGVVSRKRSYAGVLRVGWVEHRVEG